MAQFLANRIKGGHLTIGEVPESLKEQVQALLQEENMLKWLKQRFCKHKYRKHYDKATKGYVRRCVKCGKIEQEGENENEFY